ncbi:MAG: molybdopterin-dependent oxidoreductase [Chloroflexi bacterium]|nr:molybdopterin-dependent oxidoreductase [Chloroflexota bacterium]
MMPKRPLLRLGFLAGILAGIVMTALMILFSLVFGAATLPDVISSAVLQFTPTNIQDALLSTLGANLKPTFFTLLLVGQIIIAGLFGILYAALFPARPAGSRLAAEYEEYRQVSWRSGTLFSILIWLFTMLIMLPVTGVGFFGSALAGGAGLISLTYLAFHLSYGITLGYLMGRLVSTPEPQRPALATAISITRRSFLTQAVMLVAGVAAAGLLARVLSLFAEAISLPQESPTVGALPPEITPNNKFYIVTKNFVDPTINKAAWTLSIGGLVDRPYQLTYDELAAMSSASEYVTLECISNPVGGDLISNAQWRGVRLSDLLLRSGLKPGVQKVSLTAADDYTDSIPLERAMAPQTMVVYEMSGQPLPMEHGYPARLLVPGLHGYKSVKWVTRIEPVNYNFQGYWEQRGWSDVGTVHTTSIIDVPMDDGTFPLSGGQTGGVGYAGDRGIAKVELSTDGGSTWHEAKLRKALSPYTWVIWTYPWIPDKLGLHELKVRATDGTGRLQIATPKAALPDGATGLQSIIVTVQ